MTGSFTRAFRKHSALVWRVLRRSGLAPADAEDATQDVFWILYRRRADVAERAVRSFLVSTALRVASDRKKSGWARSVSGNLDTESMLSTLPGPDADLERRRAIVLLDQALSRLNDEQRAVFVLSEIEGLSRLEVAEALDCAPGTVASRLARARVLFEEAALEIRARVEAR